MTSDDKIRDKKLQYVTNEKQQKYQDYHLGKLINMNILLVKQYYLLLEDK